MEQEQIFIQVAADCKIKEKTKCKVVIIGDYGVGKTNLIKKFVEGKFSKDSIQNLGTEFLTQTYLINNEVIRVEFWDTAAQEKFRNLSANYYKGAKAAFIVYDVTNQSSFDNVNKWLKEVIGKTSTDIKIMVIGNKADLQDKKVVTPLMMQEKAISLSVMVTETSALDGTNVNETFYQLLRELYKTTISQKVKEGGVGISSGGSGVFCYYK